MALNINIENAIDLVNFAKNFRIRGIRDLEKVCRNFILDNLDKFEPDELKYLDRQVLVSILMSDDLTLREEKVWKIVQKLARTEEDHLTALMKCVRYNILEDDFRNKEVFSTVEFKRYFEENFPSALQELNNSRMQQRSPNNLVFIFGGMIQRLRYSLKQACVEELRESKCS